MCFLLEIGLNESVDTENIPDAVPRGSFKSLDLHGVEIRYITFDLETTGLSKSSKIKL